MPGAVDLKIILDLQKKIGFRTKMRIVLVSFAQPIRPFG